MFFKSYCGEIKTGLIIKKKSKKKQYNNSCYNAMNQNGIGQ